MKGRDTCGMITIARKPVYCVVLADGENWLVEAEWPDGTIEQVGTFRGYLEATNWISTRSELWLLERTQAD